MAGHTLLLDDNWDLTLDAGGGIAVTQGAYGVAQNVANAVRLFTDDAYYDPERGIPHFAIDLGVVPDLSVARNRIRRAALGVDGVADAEVEITDVVDRTLGGNIALTIETGELMDVAF